MKLAFWRKPPKRQYWINGWGPYNSPEQRDQAMEQLREVAHLNHRNLICDMLYAEYRRLNQTERQRSYWVMDAQMLALIRQATTGHASSEMRAILWADETGEPRLLNRPVEIREGVEGIHLEVAG